MINKHRISREIFPLAFIILTVIAGHFFAAMRADAQQDQQSPTGSAMAGYSTADPSDPSGPCKGMLRSLGSSMLAYAAINNHWRYGTFEDIQLAGFADRNIDIENPLDGWTVNLFLNENHSDFAIVATPIEESGEANLVSSGDSFLIDSRQNLMKITPITSITPGYDIVPSITRIEDASSGGVDKIYQWVEFEPSGDPLREYMLLLTPTRNRYLLTLTAPYIHMDEQTFEYVPEYVYLGLTNTFYVLELVDKFELPPMGSEPPPQ